MKTTTKPARFPAPRPIGNGEWRTHDGRVFRISNLVEEFDSVVTILQPPVVVGTQIRLALPVYLERGVKRLYSALRIEPLWGVRDGPLPEVYVQALAAALRVELVFEGVSLFVTSGDAMLCDSAVRFVKGDHVEQVYQRKLVHTLDKAARWYVDEEIARRGPPEVLLTFDENPERGLLGEVRGVAGPRVLPCLDRGVALRVTLGGVRMQPATGMPQPADDDAESPN